MARVAIIDYGVNNLMSVHGAFACLGIPAEIVRSLDGAAGFSHLVLPGVGSFAAGMARLRDNGLAGEIVALARRGTPLLGLCLGLQLLAESSEEFGVTPGLGLLPGRVVRIRPEGRCVPHMGWNAVHFRRPCPLADGVADGTAFYFAHSYAYEDPDAPLVAGVCDYGGAVAAVLRQGTVWGTQFHPERSQDAGLAVLRNFVASC